MRLLPDDMVRAALECGIYLTIDGGVEFRGCPSDALYDFYKTIQFSERRDVLEILGNVIERERSTRSV